MVRPKGSRNTLIRITYDDIGRLAGIAGDTARQYAQRGQFDPRNLDSLLAWVNARRTMKGLPPIGLPTEGGQMISDAPSITRIPPPPETGSLLAYDPLTCSFQEDFDA